MNIRSKVWIEEKMIPVGEEIILNWMKTRMKISWKSRQPWLLNNFRIELNFSFNESKDVEAF